MKPLITQNSNHSKIKQAVIVLGSKYFDEGISHLSKLWHISNYVQFLKREHIFVSIIILHIYSVTINRVDVSFEVGAAILKPVNILSHSVSKYIISVLVFCSLICLRSISRRLFQSGIYPFLATLHNSKSNSTLFLIFIYLMPHLGHEF